MTYRSILSAMLALALAACASATSQSPTVSRDELAREQAEQKKIVGAAQSEKSSTGTVTPTAQMQQRLNTVGEKIGAAGQTVCRELQATKCNFPFTVENKSTDAVNAYTDGSKVVVTAPMMQFATTDDQLATVLSHEYAHAVMQHPAKTSQNAAVGGLLGMAVDALANSQGFDTGGTFGKIGTQGAVLRYSQGFEKEADYIGMYILQRAGYNIANAPQLWRRMASLNPDGIYVGSTHPTTAERYVLLDKTVAEIRAKQQAGKPLLPDFRPQE